jgi:hypothetical protein
MSLKSNLPKKQKSGESPQNQLLNSGEFLPGEKFENQDSWSNQEVWQPWTYLKWEVRV